MGQNYLSSFILICEQLQGMVYLWTNISFKIEFTIFSIRILRKKELPFENKPKLPVRKVSKGEVEGKASPSDVTSTANYKPFGGVTFKENRDADVAIVGKGYGEDSQQADPKPSQYAQKARDRRKQSLQKGRCLIWFCLTNCTWHIFFNNIYLDLTL